MRKQKRTHPAIEQFNLHNSKVLRLTIDKKAFEITGTSEKPFELRKSSNWIKSRLFNKAPLCSSIPKKIDFVLLTNGYGDHRPWKLFRFSGIEVLQQNAMWSFSNGLTFETTTGDYKILLGEALTD